MKVTVEKELCVGCGMCESVLPETFEMIGTEVVVKRSELEKDHAEAAFRVMSDCPTAAVKVEEC